MIELAEAWSRIAARARALPVERRPLREAVGRVVAEPVRSALDLPPFDRSAMDGFAVRADDTVAARGDGAPVRLGLVGEVGAGDVPDVAVGDGEAVAIYTGGALPEGADAVLRSEHAVVSNGHVEPAGPLRRGQFVRYRGEDVAAGAVLLQPGGRITVQQLSALASAGVADAVVHRRARIAVLTTGDELVEPGTPLRLGQIYNSNALALGELARRTGAEVTDLGIARDDPAEIETRVREGLESDVVLVSGGVSVGERDHVKAALAAAGVEELFWRVRMKPGKPLFCGVRGDSFVFGLPGNPLSCVVGFLVFVEPLVRRLHGEGDAVLRLRPARLAAGAAPADGRTTFLSAQISEARDGTLEATPTDKQGSHMTGALAHSDGFVVVPHSAGELTAGATVDVLLLDR